MVEAMFPHKFERWSDQFCYLLATGGGVGAIPLAPGTWGAAVGALFFLAVQSLPLHFRPTVMWLLLVLSCAITVLIGPWAELYFRKKDPGSVVIDEIAGVLLTLCLFQVVGQPVLTLVWAFPITRLFDIVKLPPARQLEKLPHGWGVLLDDLMSSLYAVATLWLFRLVMPSWFGQ